MPPSPQVQAELYRPRNTVKNLTHAVLAELEIALPADAEPPSLPPPDESKIDLESLEISAGGALSTMGTVTCQDPKAALAQRR